MNLVKCRACEKDISPNAAACPNCGEPLNPVPTQPSVLAEAISPAPRSGGGAALVVVIVLLVAGVAFGGNMHVITGGHVGFRLEPRESFGFSEMFVDVDSITGMPWIAAQARFPLGCRLLQRIGVLESDEQMRERMRRETEQEIKDAQSRIEKQIRGY